MGQHQLVVAQGAARGAQLAGFLADADGMGVGQQAQLQPAGGGDPGFLDQFFRGDPAGQGDREQGLVVHVARAGGDDRDRQMALSRARRPPPAASRRGRHRR
jgi:hypothetical protein